MYPFSFDDPISKHSHYLRATKQFLLILRLKKRVNLSIVFTPLEYHKKMTRKNFELNK